MNKMRIAVIAAEAADAKERRDLAKVAFERAREYLDRKQGEGFKAVRDLREALSTVLGGGAVAAFQHTTANAIDHWETILALGGLLGNRETSLALPLCTGPNPAKARLTLDGLGGFKITFEGGDGHGERASFERHLGAKLPYIGKLNLD